MKNNLRSQFPILKTQLNGYDLIYLDSAATSQKPQEVIDAMSDFYTNHNASSHSVHSLGGQVTERVEETRQVVADFIGADVDEIVFTSGATEGINLIANGFMEASLGIVEVASVSPLSLENPISFTASPSKEEGLNHHNFTSVETPDGLSRQPLTDNMSQGNPALPSPIKGQFPPNLSQTHQTGSFAEFYPELDSGLKMTNLLVDKFKLTKDSEILICVDQHHSNILPWQRVADIIGCKIVFFGVLESGQCDMSDFESKLNSHTKVIAVSNVSNVFGILQDVGAMNYLIQRKFEVKLEFNEIDTSKNTPSGFACHPSRGEFDHHHFDNNQYTRPIIVLDATQAVSHFVIDVKKLEADFVVFSGHKIYGPTGVGVLYGKKELLEVLPNYKVGGDMVESVTLKKNMYKDSPFRFEAGTANFGSIIGLKAALDWFIRSQDEIFEIENELGEYLIQKLSEVEDLRVLDGVQNPTNPRQAMPSTPFGQYVAREPCCTLSLTRGNLPLDQRSNLCFKDKLISTKIPLVSFNIAGVNSLDLALMLDQYGVCIRSGQHCAGILHEYLGINDSCRISLACFNTREEVDFVVQKIKEILPKLK